MGVRFFVVAFVKKNIPFFPHSNTGEEVDGGQQPQVEGDRGRQSVRTGWRIRATAGEFFMLCFRKKD